jgi:hypothetical protein
MAGFGSAALGSIGMAVPGTGTNFGVPSPDEPVPGENDEERRRRQALAQQQRNPGVTALASLNGGIPSAGLLGRYGLNTFGI